MNEMVYLIWAHLHVTTVTVTAILYNDVLQTILAVASTAPVAGEIVYRSTPRLTPKVPGPYPASDNITPAVVAHSRDMYQHPAEITIVTLIVGSALS